MFDFLTVLVLIVACVAVIGFTLVLGHKCRWPRVLRLSLALAGLLLFAIPVSFFAWLAGWLNPVLAYAAQSKVDTLKRHLYVGERRADIENEFGRSIPKPDRQHGYAVSVTSPEATNADHLGQYFYAAESAFCFQGYEGIAVYYDVHDRVKRWVHYGFGDGC